MKKINPIWKVILIATIFFLFALICAKAQTTFTATRCGFSYLKTGSTWSEWSTISHNMELDLYNKGTIILIQNEDKDRFILTLLTDRITGIDSTDNVKFTAWVYDAKDRDKKDCEVIKYEYENGKRAFHFISEKWQYLYTNK